MTYKEQLAAVSLMLKNFSNELENTYKPLIDFSLSNQKQIQNILQNSINEAMKPYCQEMHSIITSSNAYKQFLEAFASSVKDLNLEFASAFDVFSNISIAIKNIRLQDSYVEVPELLIPSDFQYKEVNPDTETVNSSIKHLSYSNVIALLTIIIPFLCWKITCLRDDIASQQEQLRHEEIISVLNESNQLQKEQNQIQRDQLNLIEESLEYTYAIYQQIQESDLYSSDTDSYSQYAHLPSETDESENSTKADNSEHFDIESNNSEQH